MVIEVDVGSGILKNALLHTAAAQRKSPDKIVIAAITQSLGLESLLAGPPPKPVN